MYQIHPTCDIRKPHRIRIGEGVIVQESCWLDIAFEKEGLEPMLFIGHGTNIGRRSVVSAANLVEIGNHVLIGPEVHISDTSHEYKNPNIPIMYQGLSTTSKEVHIGDGAWIGKGCYITADVGKNSIIGFGSLVNKPIPDYSVAVGCPARVIKTYDFNKEQWDDKHLPTVSW